MHPSAHPKVNKMKEDPYNFKKLLWNEEGRTESVGDMAGADDISTVYEAKNGGQLCRGHPSRLNKQTHKVEHTISLNKEVKHSLDQSNTNFTIKGIVECELMILFALIDEHLSLGKKLLISLDDNEEGALSEAVCVAYRLYKFQYKDVNKALTRFGFSPGDKYKDKLIEIFSPKPPGPPKPPGLSTASSKVSRSTPLANGRYPDMLRHTQTHEPVRMRYACEGCDETFARKDGKTRHQKNPPAKCAANAGVLS
ncbi:hypothetical protein FA95DRAFT_1680986 [Auriscalpium vulgare]|uniref:Uncharacterized protein n=1 Tax=Auriscalpium vulgare TaxID=40419 RepID=A0ACB8RLC3_9AGAM|nr:hypothetical protein FA95DRAFT_1680986 [Auriscalpium vulgare]